MTRRPGTALVSLCALACGAGCRDAPAGPNVVLVTLDTTRADYLGCYGGPADASPNLDALAARGLLFEQCVGSSGVTPVSHATILTGRSPDRHGLRVLTAHSGYRLPREMPSLATILRARGYRTLAVHGAFPVSATFGFDRGFEHFDSFDAELVDRYLERRDAGVEELALVSFQRRADEVTERALRALEKTREPFFLWVHYFDPHDAQVLPPPEFLARDPERPAVGPGSPRGDLYQEEVRYVDAQLGRLFDALDARDGGARTLVAVIADHGQGLDDGFARHGWGGHGALYQEQLHLPLVLRLPEVPGGARIGGLVRSVDLLPTLLDYLGLAPPPGIEGQSLRTRIEGAPAAPLFAYAEQLNGYDFRSAMDERPARDDFLYCLTDGRWKLIYRPAHPYESELFDLEADPLEERDLSRAEPEELLRLLVAMAERAPWVEAPFPPDAGDAEHERTRVLLSLGYAGGERPPVEPVWRWMCPRCRAPLAPRRPCADCGLPPLLVGEE